MPAAAPPPAPAAQAGPSEPSPGGGTEYREFFDPQVDEKLRRTALKGLFKDPHFNVMDGLDTYIDDYSVADPIPEAMLRGLNQAKELLLFDEEPKAAAGATPARAHEGVAADAPAAQAGASAPPPASAAREGAELASGAAPGAAQDTEKS